MTGTGPVCALLPPVGLGGWVWRPVAERLAGHRTVVAVDLPGFGSPPLPAGTPWTVQRFTDAVADVLAARWPGPIDVAGPRCCSRPSAARRTHPRPRPLGSVTPCCWCEGTSDNPRSARGIVERSDLSISASLVKVRRVI
ncbi:MAG TPA: alpha/beta fold hydrolase [Nocardioidaceae bacterium]